VLSNDGADVRQCPVWLYGLASWLEMDPLGLVWLDQKGSGMQSTGNTLKKLESICKGQEMKHAPYAPPKRCQASGSPLLCAACSFERQPGDGKETSWEMRSGGTARSARLYFSQWFLVIKYVDLEGKFGIMVRI